MLQEVLARFGINVDISQMTAAITSMGGLAAAAAAAVVVIGGALAATLHRAIDDVVELGVETARTSEALGMSAEAVQEWGFAASRAGGGVDEIVDAMSTLQERARDAVLDPASDPAEQLRLLGVSARGAGGELKSAEQLMLEVSDGFAGMSNQTDRVGAAMTLFGDVGRNLLPVLQQGSAGINEMRERARELGGVMSSSMVAEAEAAQRSMAEFDFVMRGIKITIVREVLPAFTLMVVGAANLFASFSRLASGTNIVKNTLILLGVVGGAILTGLAIKTVIAFAPFFAAAAIVGVVVLLFDDLKTFVEGGDSAVGRLLDSIFGLGTAETVVENIRVGFEQWLYGLEALWAWFASFGPQVSASFDGWLDGLALIKAWFRSFGPQIDRSLNEWAFGFERISVWTSNLVANLRDMATWLGRVHGLIPGGAVDIDSVTKADSVPTVRAGGRGVGGATNQTNNITVNGTGLSAPEVRQAIEGGIRDANERQNRAAHRSLVTGVG